MFKNFKNFIRQGKQAHDIQIPFESEDYYIDSKGIEHVQTDSLTSDGSTTDTLIPDLNPTIDAQREYQYQQQIARNQAQAYEQQFQQQQQQQQQQQAAYERQVQAEQKQKKRNYYNYNDLASELVKEELKLKQQQSSNSYEGLENYQLYDKLGEGAFSIVLKAQNLITNEFVAIKIIKKQQLDNNQKKSVLKEATIMRQLNHENIVKFIEFKEVELYYYIVQELVPGGEIFNEIVKFTYFSEDLTRHVIKQVGESVRYLHEEIGVVHRDIKPENLLFQPIPLVPSKHSKLRKSDDPGKVDEGEFLNGIGGGGIGLVKLADFGLSKQIWYDDTKTPCGTVGYTAPEIVKDEHYSKEVDMWALGCVLYTLLCGFPPFYDEKIDILTEKVARGEYKFLQPWWDEISSGAKKCVENLLTVDPTKRYTIDEFLNDPWLNKVEFKRPKKTVLSDFKRTNTEQVYSPAARAMKDAFDISNAVHRIGEEKLLNNKNFKKNNLNTEQIMEEEEDAIESATIHPEVETRSGRILHSQEPKQIHIQEDDSNPFELKLDTSTIINRRKNKLTS